jgi:hypothetical protein
MSQKADGDFTKAVKWGCGLYLGLAAAGCILPVIGLMILFGGLGGLAVIGVAVAPPPPAGPNQRNATPLVRPVERTPDPAPVLTRVREQPSGPAPVISLREPTERTTPVEPPAAPTARPAESMPIPAEETPVSEPEPAAAPAGPSEADQVRARELLKMAKTLMKGDKVAGARKRLQEIADKYPHTEVAAEAEKLLKSLPP